MKVGEFPAVCHNLTCNYNYKVPQGEITAYTYDGWKKQLQLTGKGLPSNLKSIRRVMFAHSECEITTSSSTKLKCDLVNDPVCGDHLPMLYSKHGLVNNSASLTPTTITCTVTGITPAVPLNLVGGDYMTITGTNFPSNLETSTVSIKFSDA